MKKCDFLIVGGGIAGCSAAYFLSADHDVIILEKEDVPGYHTTGRSAAFFAETYGNETVQKITRACREFFENPPKNFTDKPLITDRGAVFFARSDQQQTCDEQYSYKKQISPEIRSLSSEEVLQDIPVLKEEYPAAGFAEQSCQDIDVSALHEGYIKGFKKQGGQLFTNQQVIEIERLETGWRVLTKGDEYYCRVLINAAGAWADELATLAGITPLSLEPRRRTVMTFDQADQHIPVQMPLSLDVDDEFYFKPESGGLLLSPCDETLMPPCDVQPDEIDIATAVDKFQKASNINVKRIRRKWAGLRTFASDRSPIIGFDDQDPGFFWCAGQGGFGIQTSPVLGMLVKSLAADQAFPEFLKAYDVSLEDISPKRFKTAS